MSYLFYYNCYPWARLNRTHAKQIKSRLNTANAGRKHQDLSRLCVELTLCFRQPDISGLYNITVFAG